MDKALRSIRCGRLLALEVPQTRIVQEAAGEPLYVELVRTGGKPAVSRVH